MNTQWHFPELDKEQNALIDLARSKGFCLFFPAFPNATQQANKTYEAAKEFLAQHYAAKVTVVNAK